MVFNDYKILIIIFAVVDVHLPEISALTCLPGTSRQNPKFTSQSNSPLLGHDISNRSKYI